MRPADPSRGVTCPYGYEGSSWATGEHGGIDYGCPKGDPVYAMWGGIVTGASWGSAYGTQLVIDHDKLPNGDPGLWAVYAHLSGKKVSAGDRVEAGQLIGTSGNSGNVSGPHLHVEVQRAAQWQQGNYVNPQPWIDAGGDDMGDAYKYDYLDKPGGTQVIGQSYVDLDLSAWDAPDSGWEHTYVYLNIEPTNWIDSAEIAGMVRLRILRADGDATGHQDILVVRRLNADKTLKLPGGSLDADGRTLAHVLYWEAGDGGKTRVQVKCEGGLTKATLHTRYTKKALVYK